MFGSEEASDRPGVRGTFHSVARGRGYALALKSRKDCASPRLGIAWLRSGCCSSISLDLGVWCAGVFGSSCGRSSINLDFPSATTGCRRGRARSSATCAARRSRAVLAVVHTAVRAALVALAAEHPTLSDLGPPDEPLTVRNARELVEVCLDLGAALDLYRRAAIAAFRICSSCDHDLPF